MNNFLKVVFLILIIEIGMIIGANIPKQVSSKYFDPNTINQIQTLNLIEFDILFNDTIKDTKGLGLGKGIVQYKWSLEFEMSVDAKDWNFNSEYKNNTIYLDAPEIMLTKHEATLIEQKQLDATNDERNARMFDEAKKSVNNQLDELQKQLLQADSLYYLQAKHKLKDKIRATYKQQSANLIIEEIIIRNWP
ncbi:hypothetical protein [Marinicellulosiphila megalodicopiae]|uniref:hypothetical protein n=1 Tax=Marinicellulosiphila megalodicopiae TaxID=2724896 RepID=UPI003BAE73EB